MAGTHARVEVLCDRLFSEDPEAAAAFREIRASLAAGDVFLAAHTCDRMLSARPDNPLFRGLQLEIENRERETRLESVQRLTAELQKMADLDARVNAVQQALKRYPAESQLTQLLSHATAMRDLYGSLVARARSQELAESYTDALTQWYVIQELYPMAPGVEEEIRRIESLADSQRRIKRRAEFVEAIFRLSSQGEYAQAMHECINALAEYPNDGGLLALKEGIEEKVPHVSELQRLTSEGITLLGNHDIDEALERFVSARGLDQNNLQTRYLIGIALLEKARLVMHSDRQRLGALLDEARSYIADHPELQVLSRTVAGLNDESSEKRVVRLEPSDADPPANVMKPSEPQRATPSLSLLAADKTSPVRSHVRKRGSLIRAAVLGLVLLGFFGILWLVYAEPSPETSTALTAVTLEVEATPERAEIFVDSRKVGVSRVREQFARGTHTITVSLVGYETQTFQVELGSEAKALRIELLPELLDVHIVSDKPGAVAWMDEQSRGEITETGLTIANVEPGVRRVMVPTMSGDIEFTFEFLPGSLPTPKSFPSRQLAYVLFAGSAEGKSRVECNCAPAGLRVGNLAELIRPEGLEIPLEEGRRDAELWVGNVQRNFSIYGSRSPVATIAVFPRTR